MRFTLALPVMLALGAAHSAMAADQALVERGHAVFGKWCEGCHRAAPALQMRGSGLVGQVFAGTYTLEQRYHGSVPAALEQRTDLSPDLIRLTVRRGLNVMPRSRKTEIPDADLDAVVAYLTQHNRASR
jgi:mono/diheme cytochrome c family protein